MNPEVWLTLDDIKAYLFPITTSTVTVATTAYDALLTDIANWVADDMESNLHGPIVQRSFTATLDGNGLQFLRLPQQPVSQLVSLTINGETIATSGTPAASGVLIYSSGIAFPDISSNFGSVPPLTVPTLQVFPEGLQNIGVSWLAGYNPVLTVFDKAFLKLCSIEWQQSPANPQGSLLGRKAFRMASSAGDVDIPIDLESARQQIYDSLANYVIR